MGSKWTVTPELVRVELTIDGETLWIDLKKQLTAGETHRLRASGLRSWSKRDGGTDQDMELNVDFDAMVFEKVRVWLADWSLTDDKGQRLSRDLDTLHALRPDLLDEIIKAVDDHAKMAANPKKVEILPPAATGSEPLLKKISSS